MPAQVVLDEALDEEVAVVVAAAHVQFEWLAGAAAGFGEQLGFNCSARNLSLVPWSMRIGAGNVRRSTSALAS